MIKVKTSQITRRNGLGVTLTPRQFWMLGWRFARSLSRTWFNVGHMTSPRENDDQGRKVLGARSQAPLAFRCLVARNKNVVFSTSEQKWVEKEFWGVWNMKDDKTGTWHYSRPCKYIQRKLP